jgi:RNA polymerase sigma-70 factor (ECF subfamily)
VNDLRAGHPEACAELVRLYHQAVYRFLVHLARDVHWAEDLIQETFAAAWQRLATFQGRSSLSTWLHRIAYTKFVDARRAERRAAAVRELCDRPKVPPADPLDMIIADEESQWLYQCLHRLDVPERTLLVLHYLQGLSYREMATVLDEPAGTVKWRTHEALSRLRALLSNEVVNHVPRKTAEPGTIS